MRLLWSILSLAVASAILTTSNPARATSTDAFPEMVLRVGYQGRGWGADQPAAVTVYRDGTVIVARASAPLGYVTFHVRAETVTELLARAGEARVGDALDYGEVLITDVGSTVVHARIGGRLQTVSVWALEEVGGLNPDQQLRRRQLSDLVRQIAGLVDDDSARVDQVVDFVPELVNVVLAPDYRIDGSGQPPIAWPLTTTPRQLVSGPESVCLTVAFSEVGPALRQQAQTWQLPDIGVLRPRAVSAALTAVLPGDAPCGGGDPITPIRRLTADEVAALGVTPAWPTDSLTTVHPFETWMVINTMARQVLPARLGGQWSWNRWSWFEHRVIGLEAGGRRYLELVATCTTFVADKEPACELRARFDRSTGELVEFRAQ